MGNCPVTLSKLLAQRELTLRFLSVRTRGPDQDHVCSRRWDGVAKLPGVIYYRLRSEGEEGRGLKRAARPDSATENGEAGGQPLRPISRMTSTTVPGEGLFILAKVSLSASPPPVTGRSRCPE